MKKPALMCLVLMVLAVACKSVHTTKETMTITPTPALVERGRGLALTVCGQCHLNPTTNTLIGVQLFDVPKALGTVYSKNITAGPKGIGNYTDAELFYLIKTGIAKDGRVLLYMMRPNIADNDLKAIIAYLRAGQGAARADDSVVGVTHYTLAGKMAMKMISKPQPYKTNITAPSPSDKIAYGKYMVDIVGCYHCHSKSVQTLNFVHPEQSKGYMAGGQKTQDASGAELYTSNLTPDKETGIGNYTLDEFRQAVRGGIGKGNRILRYPMKMYSEMSDTEVDAIYAYLMSLPPVHNPVKKTDS